MANPEILWGSEELPTYNEGCLSLPEHYADVDAPGRDPAPLPRPSERDPRDRAEGLLATCIQHEIDHLEGMLFVDHISALKRNIILRKLAKAKRQRPARPCPPSLACAGGRCLCKVMRW